MYSRSAKGGEKGDPNRNPWLAKMGLALSIGFYIGNIWAEFWEYMKLVSCENCVGFIEFILVYKSLYK
jgi:hypothetical protein